MEDTLKQALEEIRDLKDRINKLEDQVKEINAKVEDLSYRCIEQEAEISLLKKFRKNLREDWKAALLLEYQPNNQRDSLQVSSLSEQLSSSFNIWDKVLLQLKPSLPEPDFETWLKPTSFISLTDNILSIAVPNEFARDWIENRFSSIIEDAAKQIIDGKVRLKILVISRDYT